MWEHGKLFVFEGPDEVGKSTLSREFAQYLRQLGMPVEQFSFPGNDEGTLGRHIHKLHHAPARFDVQQWTATSLQTLHVAAHLDIIERRILPALESGRCVVLDRFWWSTWVYGTVGGVKPPVLEALLHVEHQQWGNVLPAVAFLITRSRSWPSDETPQHRERLSAAYRALAAQQSQRHPVENIVNDGSVKKAMKSIIRHLEHLRAGDGLPHQSRIPPPKSKKPDRAPAQRFNATSASSTGISVTSLSAVRTSEVYDTYWKFAAERQAIFFRRFEGQAEPWTDDPVLQRHKFTNAYRASDRVSQYLIRHVIYRDQDGQDQINPNHTNPDELFFRILLFKIFNRISTWQHLEAQLGEVCYADYSFARYDGILSAVKERGECIFSSAYIMPSGVTTFGYSAKHRNYLKLLERMIEDGVPWRLTELKTMQQAFELLRSYPLMGDFLAYQYAIDLNYSPLTNFSEREFVMPGPGARDGIAKCFSDLGGFGEADIIRWVADRQNEEFSRLGLEFRDLWGRSLQLIDCQNLFCEVDKYARVAHPQVQGRSGRTRIKQLFHPTTDSASCWYPPKWGLNERVRAARLNGQSGATRDVRQIHLPL
jgi:thymidylate kinase